MSANASQELAFIKSELQSIIDELYSISAGVKRDFEGIGEERCAASLNAAAQQYAVVKQKLDSMNLSVVTEEFAARKRAEAEAARRAAEAAAAEAERKRKEEAARAAEAERKRQEAAAEAERQRKAAEEAAKKNSNKKSSNSSGKKSNKKSGLEKLWEDFTEWLF